MYTMCSKLSFICHLFEHFCLWLQEDIYGKVESFIFIFVILLFVSYLKWENVGITDKLVLVWLFLKISELFCFIFLTSLKLLFSSLSYDTCIWVLWWSCTEKYLLFSRLIFLTDLFLYNPPTSQNLSTVELFFYLFVQA